MNSPLDKSTEQSCKATYLDVSPDRLNAMSPSELADAMELALESMTDDTYDSEVISAYLDALDRKSPVPEHPTAEAAYSDLQQHMKPLFVVNAQQNSSAPVNHYVGFRRALRVGLVAALLVTCLFGSMVVAQASGVDVFGAIARWTESTFGFGPLPSDDTSHNPSNSSETPGYSGSQNMKTGVPEEYQELRDALEVRDLPLYIPNIPDGFTVSESVLYTDPETENITFSILYLQDIDYIMFSVIQNDGEALTIYEKDSADVTFYECDGTTYYMFSNNGDSVVAWTAENLEYSISTNSKHIKPENLIHSFYEE